MLHRAKVTLCAGIRTKPRGRNVGKVTTGNDVGSFDTGGVFECSNKYAGKCEVLRYSKYAYFTPPLFSIRNFNILFTLRAVMMCHVFERGQCSAFARRYPIFERWGVKPEKK